MSVQVRRATARDCEEVARQASAANREDGFGSTTLTAEHIRAHAFGPGALTEILIAEDDRQPVGHAIVYRGYDVRSASPNMVLANLYVTPQARRGGVARAIITAVAQRAREQGCRRLHITTGLDNEVAHAFYAAIGAKQEQTSVFILARDALEWLATEGL
ncbi:MAG: N-acetyltransferase family protein [Hyphomonadaceae bacterium]